MKERTKNLFLKSLFITIKGFVLLPVILYIISDAEDIYAYASRPTSYSVKIFILFSILLLINIALIIFIKLKTWKILTAILLTTIYALMHYYNSEIAYSVQRSICIEGDYKNCVLKDQFEEP